MHCHTTISPPGHLPSHLPPQALVLEWIRPAAGQEVHTLDILTVAQPDGSIELVTLLYWGDCANGRTSHTTRAGYVVDAFEEKIVSTCKWCAPRPSLCALRSAQRAARSAHCS